MIAFAIAETQSNYRNSPNEPRVYCDVKKDFAAEKKKSPFSKRERAFLIQKFVTSFPPWLPLDRPSPRQRAFQSLFPSQACPPIQGLPSAKRHPGVDSSAERCGCNRRGAL